jgi:membrane protein implicated in regulation of membrane protease activity
MPWLLLLIAAALLGVALTTPSMLMLVVCGVASLGLTVFAVMSLLAQRVDSSARSDAMLIDPQELRRLREQAEARRAQSAGDAEPGPGRDGA